MYFLREKICLVENKLNGKASFSVIHLTVKLPQNKSIVLLSFSGLYEVLCDANIKIVLDQAFNHFVSKPISIQ
jgi:hypothetical protein